MKVLVVTNDFPPRVGGINYYVDHIMRRFPAGEVVVFAAGWPGAREHDATFPHPVIRWPANDMKPSRAVAARVIEIVRAERPDVFVFGATYPLGRIAPAVKAATGVPYAGFTHGVEVAISRAPVARSSFARVGRDATLLTAVSDWCRRIIRRVVGSNPRLELLPPGIDADAFHPDVETEHLRARHALGDGPVIVCVSRLVRRKGQDVTIRALPAVAAEFPDVRFVVVGGGPDEQRLRELARKHGVNDRVVFAGEVPYTELPAYFRLGDVFSMPCRHRWLGFEVEAYGAVYLQANAVARPCVAGNVGGVPEAVRDGETGLVVDGRNVDAVAEGLSTLLRDLERAAKMGRTGAEWVHRELTWDAVSARFRSMLLEAL